MEIKEKLQKKSKHVINTNAQFVTFNSNNNKFYTLLNFVYWNFLWKGYVCVPETGMTFLA